MSDCEGGHPWWCERCDEWHDCTVICESDRRRRTMSLFKSKPTTIEAVEWDGQGSVHEVIWFAGDKVQFSADGDMTLLAGKDGAQEWVPVPVGHWLVCQPGDKSDIWPVDPDYFAAKYEPADVA